MNKIQSKITTKLVVQIFVGLIGLISALISIYVFIIPEKVTKLDYEILANTNVLDINADVSKLDITYDSTSLKTTNQSLRIINIRVVNSGNESILKNYYDDNDPLGIIVKDGKIVEKPEIILTGSDYIKKNLIVKLDSSGTIFFNEIIIEPGDFFNVKLLVLYNKNQTPKIQSTGKIAGIKEIPVTSIEESKEQYSFWKTTFGGNIITQIIRLLAYTLVGFIILGLAISITIGITEYNEKRKRKKAVFQFKDSEKYDYNKMDDVIFQSFIDNGVEYLLSYGDLLENEDILNEIYTHMEEEEKENRKKNIFNSGAINFTDITDNRYAIRKMIKEGYISKEDDKLFINKRMQSSLFLFLSYLREIKYYSSKEVITEPLSS